MKKIIGIFLVVALALFIFGCTETVQNNETNQNLESNGVMDVLVPKTMVGQYVDLSPAEAKKLIETENNLVVLDVSPKWVEGHLPNAINHYIGDGSLDDAIPNLDKDKVYLVYCHVDAASIPGAQKLVDAGFEKVYRLEGNYSAWVSAGYEIEK
ncbi:MAG: rhodanese-like domain-containing protein [Candidatus Diapherotrites archaeon]|jgi:rhodanese-related sulfurtransferase|nr:rhodanese-like domain-containing protein [Candidatus Diapherotrites archaeon]